ncbi:MAG: hypothetical protein N3A66_08180, partial [Planctomycetota bacterium]|nr:hypothetical protein [Planctomycetota bacterium]
LGNRWSVLGNRTEKEKGDVDQANKDRLKSVELLRKVEGEIYRNIDIALRIPQTYFEQEMYAEAVAMYDRVIKYWSESLFTADHLLRPGKTLADLKAAAVPGEVRGKLQGLWNPEDLAKAESLEKAAEICNKFITTTDPVKNKAALAAVFAAGKTLAQADKALAEAVAQAAELLERQDLAASLEMRQRVNRAALEVAYAQYLTTASVIPFLPPASQFDALFEDFGKDYPSTPEGRKKVILLKAIHNPALNQTAADKQVVEAYRAELKKRIEEAATAQQKGELQDFDRLFDPGLRALIYGGVGADGKPIKPSYGRAQMQIEDMLRFDKQEIPTETPKQMPTKPFLLKIGQALAFQGKLVGARKKYADALVKVGKQIEALEYYQRLLEIYPEDPEILLAIAGGFTASGAKLTRESGYDQKAAEMFIRARLQCTNLRKRTREGSPLWYRSWVAQIANDVEETLARKEKNALNAEFAYEYTEKNWRGRDGKVRDVVVRVRNFAKLEDQATQTLNDLHRLLEGVPLEAAPEIQKCAEQMKELLKRMEAAGYTLKVEPLPTPS